MQKKREAGAEKNGVQKFQFFYICKTPLLDILVSLFSSCIEKVYFASKLRLTLNQFVLVH